MPAPQPVAPVWNGKTNGFSIASLSLALFGCVGVLSVVFGVIGLRQSRRNGDRRGRIYAILGLSITGLWALAIAVAIGVAVAKDIADGPDRDAAGAIRGERSIRVTDLRAGDCVKDLESQSGSRVDVLPCASAHSSEVFAVLPLPEGSPLLTGEARQQVESSCEAKLTAYAGTKPGQDAYLVLAVTPDDLDSTEFQNVLCIAHHRTSTTTGSLRR
ncbi:hypothetical protein EV385_4879 [Krasilnikovia cinnamomea]|uniref:Uncharacterized protein n=2 Tax=Krasilnikovia cinnamomea TaxID=349313 RepID=A0A4Q7ZR97_9ACTN|nr:hypothetical protein EV385_4879 [Krasilnikovia cinnamomea]